MRKFPEREERFNPAAHVKTLHDLLREIDEAPLQELDRRRLIYLADVLMKSWDLGFQNIYDAKDSYVIMYSRILKTLEDPTPFLEGLGHISSTFSWHVVSTLYEIEGLQVLLNELGMERLVATIESSLQQMFDEKELLSDDELDLNRLTMFELMLGKVLENPSLRGDVGQLVYKMKEGADRVGLQLTASDILTYKMLRSAVVRGLVSARTPEEARAFLESL